MKFNLTESGLFCVLPWLTMAFSANLGGWIADTLVSKGVSVTTVRKVLLFFLFLNIQLEGYMNQNLYVNVMIMLIFYKNLFLQYKNHILFHYPWHEQLSLV